MKINLNQFLKPTNEINLELLENIDYNDMLFCVAKSLIEYRNYYNYNQEKIAEILGVSQVMVSKIESGKYNLSIKSLVNIWNKLSTKEYNFSKKILEEMLKKSNYNYDIRFNYDIYITNSIENKYQDIINFNTSFKNSEKVYHKYEKKIDQECKREYQPVAI